MTSYPPRLSGPTPHAHDHGHHDHGHHDHGRCVDTALANADALCAARGVRLTPLRRQVLELVWAGHKPRGAYAILEDMDRAAQPRPPGQAGSGRTAPLTVYRALDFLVAQGLVHRIESLNAYVGCAHPGEAHAGQFLVCEHCGDVTELDDDGVAAAIRAAASARGFAVSAPTVEVRGTCTRCRAATTATAAAHS